MKIIDNVLIIRSINGIKKGRLRTKATVRPCMTVPVYHCRQIISSIFNTRIFVAIADSNLDRVRIRQIFNEDVNDL
jgi:hypothetical protein